MFVRPLDLAPPLPEESFREEVNAVRLLIPRNKDAGDALARNIASTPASSLRQGENIRVRVMGLPRVDEPHIGPTIEANG